MTRWRIFVLLIDEKWIWQLRTERDEIILRSKRYDTKDDCLRSVSHVKKNIARSEIVVVTTREENVVEAK